MKNKSKLNKIRQGGNKVVRNWFYMSKEVISIEDIKAVWDADYTVEIWKDQGILEVSIENGGIDLEGCPTDFWDDDSKAYLESNSVASIFNITITETGYEENKAAMQKLTNAKGGWFAADTDDFQPMLKQNLPKILKGLAEGKQK